MYCSAVLCIVGVGVVVSCSVSLVECSGVECSVVKCVVECSVM